MLGTQDAPAQENLEEFSGACPNEILSESQGFSYAPESRN